MSINLDFYINEKIFQVFQLQSKIQIKDRFKV